MLALVHLVASILLLACSPGEGKAGCSAETIRCGQRIVGRITSSDCVTRKGAFFDFFRLHRAKEGWVRVRLRSLLWAPELIVSDAPGAALEVVRGRAGAEPAEILGRIEAGEEWLLVVTYPMPYRFGGYELVLDCPVEVAGEGDGAETTTGEPEP